MIQRLYINNYRCLENFELPISKRASSLLIGRNGTGKSTVGAALQVLQRIARGTNRVGDLVRTEDLTRGRSDVPIRFELEVLIHDEIYRYVLALELPQGFKEMRVAEERLSRGGVDIFARDTAQVTLSKTSSTDAQFIVDWHLVALPLIQERSESDPLFIFKNWLARMLILAPIPSQISGDSTGDTLMPDKECSNFGEWFTGLLAHSPAAYSTIDEFIRQVMPDFKDIKNPIIGKDSRSLSVQFEQDGASLNLAFEDLSDGEKCFFICAVVFASNEAYGPIFCFWDEPDNFISLEEAGQFAMALRRSFQSGGQLLVAAHNPEAIRQFSAENTFLLDRHSHMEPTRVKSLAEVTVNGNLVDALIRGDVEI
ncbi:MAG: AAA family ATPase [Candidatus Nealsonbacteria bacterium]|nr:AAA family ATPase [Candidatus Nealsonbacteria bacterium]